MHLDPLLPLLFAIALAALVVGFVLRKAHQPHVISYIVVGFALGPFGLAIIDSPETVSRFGSLGVVMLLFFIGMEISPEKLIKRWRLALFGTLLQVLLGLVVMTAVGSLFDWPFARVVLMAFVITLSSTAVVLKLLEQSGQLNSPVGHDVLGITLMQDIAVVPMLLTISFMSGENTDSTVMIKQLIGAIVLIGLAGWAVTGERKQRTLPKIIQDDSELQLFAALTLCFGLALLSGWLELSTALGAFVAGLVAGKSYETHWIVDKLGSLRDLFVALFFLSIGLLIDLDFVIQHFGQLILLVIAVMAVNTLINGVVLKLFGRSWNDSVYGAVILSQIGEFSFIIAAVGLNSGLILEYAYQLTLALIAMTLIVSPAYIALAKALGFSQESNAGKSI
jgi:CPA2 family monovalent cation:H+ antiporter-2